MLYPCPRSTLKLSTIDLQVHYTSFLFYTQTPHQSLFLSLEPGNSLMQLFVLMYQYIEHLLHLTVCRNHLYNFVVCHIVSSVMPRHGMPAAGTIRFILC